MGVQAVILNFIQDAVMCRKCHNPETSCHTEGSKKRQALFLHCKGCGERSDLDNTDRFVRYMISHHAQDAGYGHAAQAPNATADPAADVAATSKKECPKCHHKTNKPICSKCGGATIAAETLLDGDGLDKAEQSTGGIFEDQEESTAKHKRNECPVCHHKTSKPLCGKCGARMGEKGEMLIDTVRLWMAALEASRDVVSLDDFLARMITEGFTRSTPLDNLGTVVQVIAGNVGNLFAAATTKLQPIKVAEEAKPVIAMWAGLVEELSSLAGDTRAAVDVIISKVQEGVARALPPEASAANGDCVVVGLLLALKDVGVVADGLLQGCLRIESRSNAMNKFVDFLAKDEEEDGESDESDDEDKEQGGGSATR